MRRGIKPQGRINSLSTKALVHFINSLFGSRHPLDSDVKRLSTEQIDENLNKLQPDAVISVEKSVYIIEEQTTDDANMAIRVFEYGYMQALKDKKTEGGVIMLTFPRIIVIYLEAGGATPDELIARIEFPDGTKHDFNVKTVKLLNFTVEELAEKGLGALLPFYIIRLRREAKRAKARTGKERREVEAGFRELGLKLKDAIEGGKENGRFDESDIVTLLDRLADLVRYVGIGYRTAGVKKMMSLPAASGSITRRAAGRLVL